MWTAAEKYPTPTVKHYQNVQRAQARALRTADRLWREVDARYISESWAELLPYLVATVATEQTAAAGSAIDAGAAALAATGAWRAPDAFLDPVAFTGAAPDGAPLEYMLYDAARGAKKGIRRGMSEAGALKFGRDELRTLVKTTVTDAGRAAGGVTVATRPGVGFVRMLNPPSCGRCAVLAGRFYRWNAGFRRHPRCFPAGTVISGPSLEAATRRWFEGELVTLTTSSGQELSLTGNHPVLTRGGWLPANLVQEGDEVVRSTLTEGATALVVPDHDQVPARIEDLWRAFSVGGSRRVPTTAEDFHGDGQDGEVDVVLADGSLGDRFNAATCQHAVQPGFAGGAETTGGFEIEGAAQLLDLRRASLPGGFVRGPDLGAPFSFAHALVAGLAGVAEAAARDASLGQTLGDHAAGHAVLGGEGVLAHAGLIGADDVIHRQISPASRWDAPGAAFSVETREGYAARGRDLLQRLAGQVELDRVVEVRRVEFHGHVYSPTSSEGWVSANRLIVSNCDCVHQPVAGQDRAEAEGLIADPYEYFASLPPKEQDRYFGAGAAQAIRDGADLNQVVNAQRGAEYAGISRDGTRRGQRRTGTTTEGTSRRGNYTRSGGTSPRLTPEEIYRRAGTDRAKALELLQQNGYLVPGGQVPGGAILGDREGYGALGRGGSRKGASEAVLRARATGVRDPNQRATMTEAERRVFDATLRWETVLAGRNPYGKGPLTPALAATAEADYRRIVVAADASARLTPPGRATAAR